MPDQNEALEVLSVMNDASGRESAESATARTAAAGNGSLQPDTAAESSPYSPPDWLPHVEGQLDALPDLPENWDSYGAPPPATKTVEAAREFLRSLAAVKPTPQPYVSPTPTGGVFFQWQSGKHDLEIEVVSESTVEYLHVDTDTGQTVTGSFAPGSRDEERFLETVRDDLVLQPKEA
jgi:hypothetical protein